jgi:hypothetical protein
MTDARTLRIDAAFDSRLSAPEVIARTAKATSYGQHSGRGLHQMQSRLHQPNLITLYHNTTRENAESILREGFRDHTDEYMTTQLHTGVWLSDTPLDENEGPCSEALLVLQLDEVTVAHFEWIEDGKGYREFLVPAAIVNSVKCVLALA